MRKFLCVFIMIFICLSLQINTAFGATYEVDVKPENNLAINQNNWYKPTLSTAEVKVSDAGLEMSNMTKDQNGCTYYQGGNFGEFKISMLLDAKLSVPPESSGAEWRFSNFYITFLINKNVEDCLAESAVPWYTNKCYMSLQIGLDSKGTPLITFVKYNAFSNNCYAYNYVGTNSSYNVSDGKEHWLELEVKKFSTEATETKVATTGKNMICSVDGVEVARYKYLDDTYYDSTTKKEYDVNISSITGGIGLYTNTDWPTGTAPSKMNNKLTIKKIQIVNFDKNPDGELVGQLAEPEFQITAKDYVTMASYEANELIEIRLTDLFAYEGTKVPTYEVTQNGTSVGKIANGYWSWTPTKAGNYDVDFKCFLSDTNTAINSLTLRISGGAAVDKPIEKKGCKGCNKASASLSIFGVLTVLAFGLLKK